MTDRPAKKFATVHRRGLLRWAGLLGAGAALGNVFDFPGVAHANVGPAVAAKPSTRVLESRDAAFLLGTGPFQSFGAPAGTRIGLCFLYSGSVQRRGSAPSIEAIENVTITSNEFGPFQRDLAVDNSVYRLLDALSVERPVELSGWSTTVTGDAPAREAAHTVDVTWQVTIRGRGAGATELQRSLARYHALVFGQLGRDSRFESRLSYVEVGAAG